MLWFSLNELVELVIFYRLMLESSILGLEGKEVGGLMDQLFLHGQISYKVTKW
jgi:hypothetical protein